jgi:hypothetical protein
VEERGGLAYFDARSPRSNALFFLEGHESIVLLSCTTTEEISIYYSVRELVRLLLSETGRSQSSRLKCARFYLFIQWLLHPQEILYNGTS